MRCRSNTLFMTMTVATALIAGCSLALDLDRSRTNYADGAAHSPGAL